MSKKLSFSLLVAVMLCSGLTFLSAPSNAGGWVGLGLSVRVPLPAWQVGAAVVSPHLGHVWVPGYWDWRAQRRLWVAGSWVRPYRAGAVWVAPCRTWRAGGWFYRRGYWR
jgi:hypothetical protein